jgi:hypothetical protein
MATRPAPDRAAAAALPAPGEYLCGLTWDGRHLWHSDQGTLRIYEIDPAAGRVVRELECEWVRADLAFDGSLLCQVGGRPKRLVLVDRDTGRVAGQRAIPPPSGRVTGAEMGPEGMWLLLRGPMVVQLRDYDQMTVLREYPVPGSTPSGLTYARGIVVYGEFEAGRLHAIDAATGAHVGSAPVPGRPTGLTWDGERLWYCDFPNRVVRPVELDAIGPRLL